MFTIAGLNAGPNLRNFWGEPIGTLKRLKKIKFCFFKIIFFGFHEQRRALLLVVFIKSSSLIYIYKYLLDLAGQTAEQNWLIFLTQGYHLVLT